MSPIKKTINRWSLVTTEQITLVPVIGQRGEEVSAVSVIAR